jgi:hypothetical protein
MEDPEKKLHTYDQLICSQRPKEVHCRGERKPTQNKQVNKQISDRGLQSYLSPNTKINSAWIAAPEGAAGTESLLEETRENSVTAE